MTQNGFPDADAAIRKVGASFDTWPQAVQPLPDAVAETRRVPSNPGGWCALARAYLLRKEMLSAAHALEQALIRGAPAAPVYRALGALFDQRGNGHIAVRLYNKALLCDPTIDDVAVLRLRAKLKVRAKTEDITAWIEDCGEEVNRLAPDDLTLCAFAARDFGNDDQALRLSQMAVAKDPQNPTARLRELVGLVPYIYKQDEDIEESRNAYAKKLEKLDEDVKNIGNFRVNIGNVFSASQPFFLAYQARDDLDLQKTYGKLVCNAARAAFPAYANVRQKTRPGKGADSRIRVGIVSANIRNHSNWKLRRSWLYDIDKEKFSMHGYYLGDSADEYTLIAQSMFETFFSSAKMPIEFAKKIVQDQIDILIYPELGMSVFASTLGAMRLAPVQCVSWGHPETSGRPTIDFFLTSAEMEPASNQSFYSETLIRLSGLSFGYRPLLEAPDSFDRAAAGIDPDKIVYWHAHTTKKFLPRHDDILPRIASAVPESVFILLRDNRKKYHEILVARLQDAFAAYGLCADDHCVFMDRMPSERFQSVLRLSDIYLDSLDWNGCNSTLESLSYDLPIVTLPGTFCRGRHGIGFMKMMGLEHRVVADKDAYIETAIALARDPQMRRTWSTEIQAGKSKIYEDMTATRSLEDFMETAVKDVYDR